MAAALTLVTAPTTEPVSVDEARVHARVGTVAGLEEADIALKVATARQAREAFTGRQFIEATWRLERCDFARVIVLPRPPLISVTHVKYYDADNALQTIDPVAYIVRVMSGERASASWIEFLPGFTFPSVYDRSDAVQATFKAGYGANATDVPAALRSSILLQFAELYARREEQSAGTLSKNLRAADDLCWPYRVFA